MTKQKGGATLYGPSIEAMRLQGNLGAGKSIVPHSQLNTTCGKGSSTRPTALPFVGGGLVHSNFNGSGHRPILANPGFGYKTGDNNVLFKGSRPTTSSYSSTSCHSGGKRKLKKRKTRRNSLYKKKRRTKKRRTKKRKKIRMKKRKKRRTKKRKKIRMKKRMYFGKSHKRNNLIGCGQKGGGNVQYGFPGPFEKSLGDHRLWKGNGITVKNNFNCPDNYNHFLK